MIVFVLLAACGGVGYFLFFSSVFEIKKIEVSKVSKVSAKEIENTVWQKSRKNILLANFNPLTKSFLEKYPQIETMEIKKKLPNKLLVQIKEREPAAIFEDYYLIDKNGVVFERAGDSDFLKIKRRDFNKKIDFGEQYLKKEILEKVLKAGKSFNIKEIEIISDKRINAKTDEPWEIYFSLEKDIGLQITELEILLKEKLPLEERGNLEYIDLRFEKIYFKRSN